MVARFYRAVLIGFLFVACGTAAVPSTPAPTITFAAEPTRPPSCPASYPDPQVYGDSAYVGPGTVVAVIDGSQMRVTVDVPAGHPFSGQTLLLKLHSSATLTPGSTKDLIAFGLRAGDRVQLDVWHFLPQECSYVVIKITKLAI